MNDLTITCPNCHSEIRLSEAVSHRLREQISGEFAGKLEAQQKNFAEREKQLRQQQSQLEQAKLVLDGEVAQRVAEEKVKLLAAARQQVQSQLSLEMQDLRSQLTDRTQKLEQAQASELKLRKQQVALEERQQALELEVARTLDEERGKIRETAKLQASEEQRLRLAEKEKLIGDLQKQIDTLKQKAEQGSMQLQGEVLELDLEERLRAMFITDS
ncbi:MAG: DUF2130 domain-containing protein, partial [Verrucomicrobiales bacterium]|nr:DUF2130 domain-containing protein [Verrucomicrobiales bacterium]